jgi:CheY-like chemotaxis protein
LSPAELIEDVVLLMRDRANGKGITLCIEHEAPVPRVIFSDPTRLRQILLNLIGNAVKFTERGSVTVRTRYRARGDATGSLSFAVVDTGIGMTPEQRDKISSFDAFTQADGSTTRKFGGTGLGLRIVSCLTDLLGGQLKVASEYGVGSEFVATVDAGDLTGVGMLSLEALTRELRETRSRKTETVTVTESNLDEITILLAEDGRDNQRLISHILGKAGATVTVVENGRVAVDEALAAESRQAAFDVVLMDMQMPILDGYSATSELRERQYSGLIFALTAHAMASDREKCLDAGCDDFATKPIQKAALIELIRTKCDERSAAPRN